MSYVKLTEPIDLTKTQFDNRTLHNHQVSALENLDAYFDLSLKTNFEQNGILVMPTGSGKTFTAVNWLLERAVSKGYRVLWLVHRQELVGQADLTFRRQAPLLSNYGFKKLRILPISGSHYSISQSSRYDINVCSIGSVASKNGMRYIRRMIGNIGLEKLIIVIDEAHHAVSPSYQKVIKKITELNPKRILLGLTATPTRMQENDYNKLLKIFNMLNNKMNNTGTKKGFVYEVTLKELLLAGFLAQPIYKRVETNINGDVEYKWTVEDELYFNKFLELSPDLLEKVAKSSDRNKVIVDEYIKNKEKYGKTLIFAVNRLHCKTLYEEFKKAGVCCAYCISGEDGVEETIEGFKNSKFDVLINVQILTEGSDVPDIQSVFLTRQTNSDSLLMQMIGRGLRGLDAGGTKYAYVVDFHDTWDKYNFWLDPKELEIFEKVDQLVVDNVEIVEMTYEDKVACQQLDYDYWELCLKLYNTMRTNLTGASNKEIFPDGWYSVVDENGNDIKVLVYDGQLDGFGLIEENKNIIIKNKYNANYVLKKYFDLEYNLPSKEEIQIVIDELCESGEMPTYYTFRERDSVDAKEIAKRLVALDIKQRSDRDYWLKNLYESTPLVKELYKTFFLFRTTVENYIKAPNENKQAIVSIDEREDFDIIQEFYDLKKLQKEICDEYFPTDDCVKPEIRWSNKPLRSRYGLCTRFENGDYVIAVNKLLSSPNVPIDVVKYIIYHELLHANGYWSHNEKFRDMEWKYPNSDELDGFLDELFIKYKIDEIIPPRRRKETEVSI